jgi:hypothetical protein
VSRRPQPPREQIAPEELPAYDSVVGRYQRSRRDRPEELRHEHDAGHYFGTLLWSPPFAEAMSDLVGVARTRGEHEGTYSHADRELVDQVLCADWMTTCVQRSHIPDAVAVGVRIEAIEALRQGREEELTADERLLVDHVRAVVAGTVTDELYAAIERRLGERGAAEYTIFIGVLIMTIRVHQAFGVPEVPNEEIDAMLQGFRDGTRPLGDYTVRIQ